MEYAFCCVDLATYAVNALHAMQDSATPITYRTMRRNCPDLLKWAGAHSYDRWLTLSQDWHVGFYKSTFGGEPCYYLTHSAIEYVWLQKENFGQSYGYGERPRITLASHPN